MNDMPNVNFLPWIGENYLNQDLKILILGESFYLKKKGENPDDFNKKSNLATEIIEKRISLTPNSSLQTFLNTNRMILGKKNSTEAGQLWHNLAFYNFIQKIAGNSTEDNKKHRSKKYITKDIIEESRIALNTVLSDLQPDLVIVWGQGILHKKWLSPNKQTQNKELKLWFYPSHPNCIFWNIKHPSAFFSWEKYHPRYLQVKEYIQHNKNN